MKRSLYFVFSLAVATGCAYPQVEESTITQDPLDVIFGIVTEESDNVSWIEDGEQRALNINGDLHNIGLSGKLMINTTSPVTNASRYAATIARVMAIWEGTQAFDEIEYTAHAANSFIYQPMVGLKWSPSVVPGYLDDRLIGAYAKVKNPEHVKTRFSWLVSTVGDGELGDDLNWAIPYSEARHRSPPAGYKWHHTPFWNREVPSEYDIYVPSSWTGDDTWKAEDLRYSLSITKQQLDAFAAIPKDTKGEYIADLILDSYELLTSK